MLPCIEPLAVYTDQAGAEIESQMYVFPDKAGRSLCLRPEGTASVRAIGLPPGSRLWYETRCWRYERPQRGRYREFTQFGVEFIGDGSEDLVDMAVSMVRAVYGGPIEIDTAAARGLAYYRGGRGFEIRIPSLGAQKQVAGGGQYPEGVGFAIGVDRLVLAALPPLAGSGMMGG